MKRLKRIKYNRSALNNGSYDATIGACHIGNYPTKRQAQKLAPTELRILLSGNCSKTFQKLLKSECYG